MCTMVLEAPYFRIIEFAYGFNDKHLAKDKVYKCYKRSLQATYLASMFCERKCLM